MRGINSIMTVDGKLKRGLFKRADALSTFAWVVGCSIAMIIFNNPVSGAIMTGFLLLLIIIGRDVPLTRIVRDLPIILLVPACLLFFHAISHPGRIIINLDSVTVTWEGHRGGCSDFFS